MHRNAIDRGGHTADTEPEETGCEFHLTVTPYPGADRSQPLRLLPISQRDLDDAIDDANRRSRFIAIAAVCVAVALGAVVLALVLALRV